MNKRLFKVFAFCCLLNITVFNVTKIFRLAFKQFVQSNLLLNIMYQKIYQKVLFPRSFPVYNSIYQTTPFFQQALNFFSF